MVRVGACGRETSEGCAGEHGVPEAMENHAEAVDAYGEPRKVAS
jgi:hypothetical protein